MPKYSYDVKIGNDTYTVGSDTELSDVQAYQYARMQAVAPAATTPVPKVDEAIADHPAPDRTLGDYLKMSGRAILHGAGEVADFANQVNPLHQIASAIADTTGLTKELPDFINKSNADKSQVVANALNLPKPVSNNEKLMYAGVKGATGALIPVAGEEAAAASVAKSLGERVLPALSNLGVQTAAGGLSGLASEETRQSGGGTAAQIAAGLITGAGLPLAASTGKNLLGGLVKNFDWLNPIGSKEIAARQLQTRAGGTEAAQQAAQNIDAAQAQVSGATPTVAELAGNRGIAALQREQTVGVPGNEIQARLNANARLRAQATDETFGQGNQQAVQDAAQQQVATGEAELSSRVARRVAARQQLEQQQQADLEAQKASHVQGQAYLAAQQAAERQQAGAAGGEALQARTEAIGSADAPEQAAKTFRQRFTDAYQAVKDRTTALYNVPALANPVKLNIPKARADQMYEDVLDATDQYHGDLGGDVHTTLRKIVGGLFDSVDNKTVNTRAVANVDKQLADFAGEATTSGRAADASFANKLRQIVSDNVNEFVPRRVKNALEAAKASRYDQAQRFEQGDLGAAFKPMAMGEVRTPDTELVKQLVTTGDPGATVGDQLIASVGQDHAEELVANEMRRQAEAGAFDGRAGARKYSRVLSRFDGVKDRVDAMIAQAGENDAGMKQLEDAHTKAFQMQKASDTAAIKTQQQANTTVLQAHDAATEAYTGRQATANAALKESPLGSMAPDQVSVNTRVSSLLKSNEGKGLDILYDQVKHDPEQVDGVRRALAEHINNMGPTKGKYDPDLGRVPNTADTLAAIDQVTARGGRFLTDDQHIMLQSLKKEMIAAEAAKTSGVRSAADTGLTRGTVPWVGPVRAVLKFALEHFTNRNKVDALIHKSIMEPDFASELLKRATPDRIANVKRAARQATTGAVAGVATQQYPGLVGSVTGTGSGPPYTQGQ